MTQAGYISTGAAWNAFVVSSPQGDLCKMAPDSIFSSTVTGPLTLTVTCTPVPATISGIISNLDTNNQLTIQDNGTDNYTVIGESGLRKFTFPTPINVGSNYA